jgi:hypothetical protein
MPHADQRFVDRPVVGEFDILDAATLLAIAVLVLATGALAREKKK